MAVMEEIRSRLAFPSVSIQTSAIGRLESLISDTAAIDSASQPHTGTAASPGQLWARGCGCCVSMLRCTAATCALRPMVSTDCYTAAA